MKNRRIGKVYIVCWGFADDWLIQDVFATRKAAEAYIAEHVKTIAVSRYAPRPQDQFSIDEREVKG